MKLKSFLTASNPVKIFVFSLFSLVTVISCKREEYKSITFDVYGGIENLQGHNESGFFRTELIDGRWWLIDPLNNAFLSLGSDSVSFYADFAPLLGYSPYYLNLMAKFGGAGPEHKNLWAQGVMERYKLLGFNTIGSWGEIEYFKSRVSYTFNLNFTPEVVKNFGSNNVPTVSKGWWIGFPDVFDIKFNENCKEVAWKKITEETKNDSYLIGYFTDNELNWFGGNQFWDNPAHTLSDDFISSPADYSGKQYWVNEFLKKKKGYTIESLNLSYGTNFSSWDEVLSVSQISNSPSYPAIENDKKEFLYEVGEQYFRVTNDAIKSADPNHMNLCARFASDAPDEIVQKAGKYCDVLSVNDYYALDNEISNQLLGDPQERWRRLYKDTKAESEGKPFIQTEFGIRARDSGLPNSWGAGWSVEHQEERGQFYRDDLDRLLWLNSEGENFLVGFHWFKWADEPATGRFDGENSNYGLNNIKDEPYLTFYKMLGKYNQVVYYRLLGLKYKKLDVPELIYPEEGKIFDAMWFQDFNSNLKKTTPPLPPPIYPDKFSWKKVSGATGYTLLISSFRNFAEGVTVQIPVQENPEEISIALPQGEWFWTVSAEGDESISSDFAVPWSFTVSQYICGDYNNPAVWQNYVETPIPDNSDGSAIMLPKIGGGVQNYEPLQLIFTINSLGRNNPVNGGSGRRVILKSIDCRESIPSANTITFNIMPASIVDTSSNFSVSTRFLRIYVKDAGGAEIVNQQIDPTGSLVPEQWHTIAIPLNGAIPKEIGFYIDMSEPGIPLDQRIVSWLREMKVVE